MFGTLRDLNLQLSKLVIGVDLSYKNPSILQAATYNSLRHTFDTSDDISHDVTITAESTFKLVDYAALRARAGYAFGQFLPYTAVGIAVGRFNYHTTVPVTDGMTQLLPAPPVFLGTFQQSASVGQNNFFVAGVAAALGVDWLLTPSVFLRGEWEYIKFLAVKNTVVQANNLHLGIGYKF